MVDDGETGAQLGLPSKQTPHQSKSRSGTRWQSAQGQDYDDTVVIPMSAYLTKIQGGLKNYISGSIMVSATTSDATARAEREIT